MNRTAKRAALTALTTAAAAATLTGLTATSAFAIDEVPCGPPDYTQVEMHSDHQMVLCYANGGEVKYSYDTRWVTKITTGNNHVQWFGDGRWQPDTPIPPHTVFTWDNHPGGVRIDGLRIV